MNKLLYQIFAALILIQFQTLVASNQKIGALPNPDIYNSSPNNPTRLKNQKLITLISTINENNRTMQKYSDGTTRTTYLKGNNITYNCEEIAAHILRISDEKIHILETVTIYYFESINENDNQDQLITQNLFSGETQRIDPRTGEIVP